MSHRSLHDIMKHKVRSLFSCRPRSTFTRSLLNSELYNLLIKVTRSITVICNVHSCEHASLICNGVTIIGLVYIIHT